MYCHQYRISLAEVECDVQNALYMCMCMQDDHRCFPLLSLPPSLSLLPVTLWRLGEGLIDRYYNVKAGPALCICFPSHSSIYTLKWTLTILTVEVNGYTTSFPCLMLGARLIHLRYHHSDSPRPRTTPINIDWGYARLASPRPRTTPINIDWGYARLASPRPRTTPLNIDWDYARLASPRPRTTPINIDWGYARLASPRPRTTPINIDSGLRPA